MHHLLLLWLLWLPHHRSFIITLALLVLHCLRLFGGELRWLLMMMLLLVVCLCLPHVAAACRLNLSRVRSMSSSGDGAPESAGVSMLAPRWMRVGREAFREQIPGRVGAASVALGGARVEREAR